jgi:hypothetical protein
MNKQLRVNAKTIRESTVADSHQCMIANTIAEQIPNAKYISVDTQSIRYTNVKTGRRHIYLTPPVAQKAILAFDAGKPVKPFTLSLNQGVTRKIRRQPDSAPIKSSRHYARNPKRVMPAREREFGLRKLVSR